VLLRSTVLAGLLALGIAPPVAGADDREERVIEAFGRGDLATAERLLEELLAADPGHPEHLYNLACARSLRGDQEDAARRLLEAVDAGFRDRRIIEEDPDLAALRAHAAFAAVREVLDRTGDRPNADAARSSLAAWLDRFGPSRYRVEEDRERSLVIATSLGEASHREMIEMLDAQADHQVRTLFGRHPEHPVLLVVATPEDAARFFASSTTAGLYDHARRRLVTRDIGESLRHEFTHLLHHAQMERLGQKHPIWIQEGLASLYEAYVLAPDGSIEFTPNSRHNVAFRATRAGAMRPWSEVLALDPKGFMKEANRLYPQVRSMFEFIDAEAGLPRFWEAYLRTYSQRPDGSAALEEVLGEDLAALDKRWKKWVVERGGIDDSVRPGDASLGIEGEDLPDGVKVTRILPSSAASAAGVRRGDVLLAIDEAPIRSGREMLLAIAARRVGETVSLRLRRGAGTIELAAVLRPLPRGATGTGISPPSRDRGADR